MRVMNGMIADLDRIDGLVELPGSYRRGHERRVSKIIAR